MTVTQKIQRGLQVLRTEHGYLAEGPWWCCQSCGCAAVPKQFHEKYVFYHDQDADGLKQPKGTKGLYLAWAGDPELIVKVFRDQGLSVVHDGLKNHRIYVGE